MAFLAVPAAEEAGGAVAGKVAAKRAAKKAGAARAGGSKPAGSRNLNDLGSQAEREAELQARAKQARRKGNADVVEQLRAEGQSLPEPEQQGAPAAAPSSSGGGGLPSLSLSELRPSSVGGGVVLGTFAWFLGLTYLRGGREGVTRWLKAKFLNEVAG